MNTPQWTATPAAVVLLTLIGTVIASRKTRGGSGMHLAIGFVTAALFILSDRFSTVFATKSNFPPLLAAWLLHGIVLCAGLFFGTPRFGFAPALSVTAWLVLTVYAVESHLFPQLQERWALAALGAVAVLLALLFPGNPLHASALPWLPLHWALGIASYGLFAAAVVHAWLMMRAQSANGIAPLRSRYMRLSERRFMPSMNSIAR